MLCIAVRGPSFEEAYQQIIEASQTADIIELRLDYFEKSCLEKIQTLKSLCSSPFIFTLRSIEQGGHFLGTEEERLSIIESLLSHKPEFIDLEYNVPPAFAQRLMKNHPSVKIIVSFHDFEKSPKNYNAILNKMKKLPANYYKIASTSRSSLEAMHLLHFTKTSKTPLISISMGEKGIFTRIVAPIFGSFITYSSLADKQNTAPGQLSSHILTEVYRCRSLTEKSSIYGLIGSPIHKSISEYTHNAVFSFFKIDAAYIKMEVEPEEIPSFLLYAKKLNIKGLSVTMPLKEQLLRHIDVIDSPAKNIGAINTILFKKNELIGYNTDGKGSLDALEEKIAVKGKKIVVIGSGGAAKAFIYEAIQRGAEVIILNRNEKKAKDLALQMCCLGDSLDAMETQYLNHYDILVNATPNPLPINPKWIIPQSFVMDFTTKPKKTKLLMEAHKKGCTLIYGYKMFIHQAIAQFSLWFGEQFPPREIKKILEKEAEKILGI